MDLGECESLFKFGDKDQDGFISFEEFVLMIIPDEYHISEELVNEVKKMDHFDLINS
jgi:Ca2+-binding EF-hand superfamily protein